MLVYNMVEIPRGLGTNTSQRQRNELLFGPRWAGLGPSPNRRLVIRASSKRTVFVPRGSTLWDFLEEVPPVQGGWSESLNSGHRMAGRPFAGV